MFSRPSFVALDLLRATLAELEAKPGQDEASVVELKRVLLNRIADIELSRPLQPAQGEPDKAPLGTIPMRPASPLPTDG
jgi:hypothetical protein